MDGSASLLPIRLFTSVVLKEPLWVEPPRSGATTGRPAFGASWSFERGLGIDRSRPRGAGAKRQIFTD